MMFSFALVFFLFLIFGSSQVYAAEYQEISIDNPQYADFTKLNHEGENHIYFSFIPKITYRYCFESENAQAPLSISVLKKNGQECAFLWGNYNVSYDSDKSLSYHQNHYPVYEAGTEYIVDVYYKDFTRATRSVKVFCSYFLYDNASVETNDVFYTGSPISYDSLGAKAYWGELRSKNSTRFYFDADYYFSKYDESTGQYSEKTSTFDGGPGKYYIYGYPKSSETNLRGYSVSSITIDNRLDITSKKYKFDYNYKRTYMGAPLSTDIMGYTFEYVDDNASNSTTIRPDVTYKYRKYDRESKKYGKYQDGLPSDGGEFILTITGVAPYYGQRNEQVSIVDGLDVSPDGPYYNSWSNSIQYTGKPIDLNMFQIYAYIYIENEYPYEDYKNYLNYGVDYEILGYTYYNANIESVEEFNSLKILPGLPSEKGDYYIVYKGIGKYHGIGFLNVRIYDSLDYNAITIQGTITGDKQKITTYSDRYMFYNYIPKESGKYMIYTSSELNCKYSIYMYDKNGCMINSLVASGSKTDDPEKNDCYVIVDLKAGEKYCLAFRSDMKDCKSVVLNIYKFGSKISESSKTDPATKVSKDKSDSVPLKKGKIFNIGKLQYKVTNSAKGKATVSLYKNKNKKIKSVVIPEKVTYKGVSYKVTSINSNAFKGCKNLKKITFKSLNIKKIGKNAFKGINKKAVFVVPIKKKTVYTKLLKKSGIDNVVIKMK